MSLETGAKFIGWFHFLLATMAVIYFTIIGFSLITQGEKVTHKKIKIRFYVIRKYFFSRTCRACNRDDLLHCLVRDCILYEIVR
jgi:hypothetical protein